MVKRILIRTLLGAAILFVFIAGTISLMRGLGGSQLEKFKRELRQRGEKFQVSELGADPSGSNTLALTLGAAHKALGRPAPTMQLMRTLRPGVAQAAWKQTNSWTGMHAMLDEAAVPLADIREALRTRPRDQGWNYTNWNTYSTETLIELRKAAYWLASAAVIELNRGRRGEALTNLLSLLDLAHCQEGEATLVSQMVRVAVAGMAIAGTWEALQATGWTDEQLAAVQKSWEEFTVAKTLELSLRMERALALTFFESEDRGTNATYMTGAALFPNEVYTPVWRVALSKGDELHYLQSIQGFLEAMRAAREHSSRLEFHRRLPPPAGWLARYRYPMAHAAMPNYRKALDRWLRFETERQMALAAIGLERFRLRRGVYPERLEELVPEILKVVPVDFGDGKPLRYEREGTHFRIWSVMEDAVWPRAED